MEQTIFTFIGSILGHGTAMVLGHIALVVAIIIYIANKATNKLTLVPKGWQNVMEIYLEGVLAMGKDVVGEKYAKKYLPLVATIGLFVFFSNVIGIIPGFESPTANINVTLPLAVAVFVYYNYEGGFKGNNWVVNLNLTFKTTFMGTQVSQATLATLWIGSPIGGLGNSSPFPTEIG